MLGHLNSKEVFCHIQVELCVHLFLPTDVVLVLSTTEKSLDPSSLLPPFGYLDTLMK